MSYFKQVLLIALCHIKDWKICVVNRKYKPSDMKTTNKTRDKQGRFQTLYINTPRNGVISNWAQIE